MNQNFKPEIKTEKPRLWIPTLVITVINIGSLVLFAIFAFKVGEWIYILPWFIIVLGMPLAWKAYKKFTVKQFFALFGSSILFTVLGTILFGFLFLVSGLGAFDNVIFSTQNFFGGPKILWRADLGQSPQLALEGNTIYTWSYYSSDLIALDKVSGKTIKKYGIEGNTTASDLADGILFKLKKGVDLLAIDLAAWQEKWSRNIEDFESTPRGNPVIAAGRRVYVGVKPNKIAAFGYTSGERLWNYETVLYTDYDPESSLSKRPPYIVVDDNILLVGFVDGRVYALDSTAGTQLWGFVTSIEGTPQALLVKDGIAYVSVYGISSNQTHAFNAETGKKMWRVPGTASGGANGMLYVINNYGDLLQAIDINGKIVWQRELPHNHTTGLIVSNGILYYGSYNDPVGLDFSPQRTEFYAVNPQTGKTIWEYKISGQIQGNFVVNDGVVYLLKRNKAGTATELIALQKQ